MAIDTPLSQLYLARAKLGCIVADWNCARDLCNNLVAAGMCVTWLQEAPGQPLLADDDALVVSVRARQGEPGDAVARVLRALMWLRERGVRQVVWVVPPALHVGAQGEPRTLPLRVLRALLHAMGQEFTVVVPSDPEQGMRLLKGHLFKDDQLLSDAWPHPPDGPPVPSNLLAVLRNQLDLPVTLINLETVQDGAITLQTHLAGMRLQGPGVALVDASDDTDLSFIAQSVRTEPLIAASASLGIALPQLYGITPNLACARLPAPRGHRAVICGTSAPATAQQIRHLHAAGHAVMAIDPIKVSKHGAERVAQAALAWAEPLLATKVVLLYSTLNAATREAASSLLGAANAALLVEDCLALVAAGLLKAGVRQMVLAGDDTGQRCLRQLGLRQMLVGAQMDGGAPWCFAPLDAPRPGVSPDAIDGIHVLVKPDDAGQSDFFLRAFEGLMQEPSL